MHVHFEGDNHMIERILYGWSFHMKFIKLAECLFIMLASYLADFSTRWPHEYEILNFGNFRQEFGKKPTLSRSMYKGCRWSHNGHTNATRLYPKHSRTIYEVVVLHTMLMRMVHEGFTKASRCLHDIVRCKMYSQKCPKGIT